MITVTYTCDRCGHTQDAEEESKGKPHYRSMWKVAVSYGFRSLYSHKYEQLWCRVCMENMQILPYVDTKPEDPPTPTPPPTLEDLIREIVRKEIQQ